MTNPPGHSASPFDEEQDPKPAPPPEPDPEPTTSGELFEKSDDPPETYEPPAPREEFLIDTKHRSDE